MSDEHDWMAAALASLHPQAMPDDVRARLDEAIAAEAAGAPVPAVSSPGGAGVPVAIPGQRTHGAASPVRRRRTWISGLAGVAAALALFAVVDPFAVIQLEQSDSAFTAPMQLDDSLAGAPAESRTAPQAETGAAPAEGLAVGQVLLASGTPYSRSELASQAAVTARTAGGGSADASFSEGELSAAEACVAALPIRGELVFVDRARFEGEPALIVARRSGSVLEVLVLGAACTAADPAIAYRATVEAP